MSIWFLCEVIIQWFMLLGELSICASCLRSAYLQNSSFKLNLFHRLYLKLHYDMQCLTIFLTISAHCTCSIYLFGGSKDFWTAINVRCLRTGNSYLPLSLTVRKTLWISCYLERNVCPVVHETFKKVSWKIQKRRWSREFRMLSVKILSLHSSMTFSPSSFFHVVSGAAATASAPTGSSGQPWGAPVGTPVRPGPGKTRASMRGRPQETERCCSVLWVSGVLQTRALCCCGCFINVRRAHFNSLNFFYHLKYMIKSENSGHLLCLYWLLQINI